jgi:hypothetical protein
MQPQKIGGLSYNGAIPKQSYPTSSGVIGGMSKPQTQPNQSYTTATGNVAGVYQPKDTTMKGVSTPPTVNIGGKEQVMKGSPSVLAQQQALNKQGAGLVEDGIAGRLTKDAIAKYGSNASTTKDTQTGNTTDTTKTETPKVETPAPLTTGGQAPGVLGTGNQTANEIETQKRLMELSQKGSPEYQQAYNNWNQLSNQYNQDLMGYNTNVAGLLSQPGVTKETAQGGSSTYQMVHGAGLQAEATGVSNALGAMGQANTQQGLQNTAGQGAYNGAQTQAGRATTAGTSVLGAVAPMQVPYSNQVIQPGMLGSTGSSTSGTAMSQLPQQAQTAVQSYAQQVKDGSMTRDVAEGHLSAYGIAGTNALNEVLGSNFNTNASNASATTTAQGQQIQTQTKTANDALDTLGTSFASLGGLQKGGIPVTNSIAQWIGTELGDSALSKYKSNLADARAQLVGVLSQAGGTPTGNEATAMQYLPDNMTPSMFAQNVGTVQAPGIVRTLMQQKVNQFTGSGSQNQTSGSQTGGVQYNTDGTLKAVSF